MDFKSGVNCWSSTAQFNEAMIDQVVGEQWAKLRLSTPGQ